VLRPNNNYRSALARDVHRLLDENNTPRVPELIVDDVLKSDLVRPSATGGT